MIARFKRSVFPILFSVTGLFLQPAFATEQFYPLVDWLDPMREGFGAKLSFSDRLGDTLYQSAQLTTNYGFGQGFSATASIPVVLSDIGSSLQAPRIGGGGLSRIEFDGLFRLWGDPYDYFILKLGLALPLQSDSVLQKSALASWAIPFEADWRLDWTWIAFLGRVSASPQIPAIVPLKSDTLRHDSSSNVTTELELTFLSRKRLSPSIHWTEVFPRIQDTGIEVGANSFVMSETSSPRGRYLGVSIDMAPMSTPMVLSLDVERDLLAPENGKPLLSVTGQVRWLF